MVEVGEDRGEDVPGVEMVRKCEGMAFVRAANEGWLPTERK